MAFPLLIPLIAAGAGMLTQGMQAQQQKKALEDQNRKEAELAAIQTMYSPWLKVSTPNYKSAEGINPMVAGLGGAIQGGLGGAMFAQQFKNKDDSAQQIADATAQGTGKSYAGSYGSPWQLLGRPTLYDTMRA